MSSPFDIARQSRKWKLSTAIPLGLFQGRTAAKADRAPKYEGDRRPKIDAASGRLLFDALEPRFLLNGEILIVDNSVGAAATQNHSLLVELVSHATTGDVHAAQQNAQVKIINQVNNAVVAQAPLDATSGIVVKGGSAKDALTVDAQSLPGYVAPPITFSGGGGANQLTITGAGSQTWRVTGPDAGSVSGQASVNFSQVGTLVGGSNVDDTFVVAPKGSLTGGVDGGAGGFDSLDFPDVQAGTVTFNSTGPHSGNVVIDRVTTNYTGLSPVAVSGTVANVIVNAPAANDQTLLEVDPNVSGSLTFLSQNNMLESASFTLPTQSLTVNLTGVNDSLAIDNFASNSGASLTVNATAGSGSADVTSGALISTRNTGGGDPISAPSVGVSGNVTITAQTISVDSGASILAYGDSGFNGGVVTLSANATGAGAGDQSATVTVDSATVKAGSLSMTAAVSQTAAVNSALTANADFANTAASQIEGASLIQTAGDITVGASSAAGAGVTATAQALPATNVDAAVASAVVTSGATAEIGGDSVVTAGGKVGVLAGNDVLVEIAGNGALGGSTAGGATVGLALVTTNTSATINDGASVSAGGSVLAVATSDVFVKNTATATAQGATSNSATTQQLMMNNNAATADGAVAVASAVAVTHLSQTTQASIDASGPISAAGPVGVAVVNGSVVHTAADASAVFGGAGVGAAVAINAVNVDSEASISGEATISAPIVTVTSDPIGGTTDTFTVAALSGAGASPLGVAGALAINAVNDTSHAFIGPDSALTFNGSGVLIGAGEATSASATAAPGQSVFGAPDGLGASVAVNEIKTETDAGVQQGASLGGAGSLLVTALAKHTATTTATAGAAGGNATAAAVALTDASNVAVAHLDASSVVNASGPVTLGALQSSTTTTTATGVVAGELTAVVAVVAIGIASDQTTATSDGEIDAGGAVRLTASGGVANAITATSGTRGASASGANANGLIGSQLGYLGLPTTLVPSAATADGAVGISAALGVGYTDDSISAEQTNGLITASGPLTLDASGVAAGVTAANAQPVNSALPGSGVAAAAAINVGKEEIVARVDGTIAAAGVTLDASPVNPGADFGALAISGVGASNVGVAGAFALNVTTTQSNATIDSSAAVNAGGLAVTVSAGNLTHDGADATAQLTSTSPVGVGASVAVDLANTSVAATVASGASVTNAGRVRIASAGGTGEVTSATGGAAGGNATAASVALTDAQGSATAQVAVGASVKASGAVTLQATGADLAATTGAAAADGVSSAIGAVIAMGLVTDQTAATSAGEIRAGGAVGLVAAGGVGNGVGATAGSLGASASGASANTAIGSQLGYIGLPTTLIPSAATADGAVGVAAALGVGYTNDLVSAQQTSGTIAAGGALTLAAGGTATGATAASGQSVSAALPGVGVGAAVAVNVGKQTFLADLDANATAAGVALTTLPVQPDVAFSALAISGAGATQVGVAGSLALDVATTQSNALIDSAAQVDAGGQGVSLTAANQTSNTADAYSQVGAKSPVGIGASVAINIVNAGVSASEVDGAALTDAGAVTFGGNGHDSATTNAIGGASGGTATAASVALTYAQDSVTAQLQSGAQINASGAVNIRASHIGGAATTAAGVAAGTATAVGAAVAVGIVRDTTLADSSGALDAQGTVGILATGLTFNAVTSAAGLTGANPSGSPPPAEILPAGVPRQSPRRSPAGRSDTRRRDRRERRARRWGDARRRNGVAEPGRDHDAGRRFAPRARRKRRSC